MISLKIAIIDSIVLKCKCSRKTATVIYNDVSNPKNSDDFKVKLPINPIKNKIGCADSGVCLIFEQGKCNLGNCKHYKHIRTSK